MLEQYEVSVFELPSAEYVVTHCCPLCDSGLYLIVGIETALVSEREKDLGDSYVCRRCGCRFNVRKKAGPPRPIGCRQADLSD